MRAPRGARAVALATIAIATSACSREETTTREVKLESRTVGPVIGAPATQAAPAAPPDAGTPIDWSEAAAPTAIVSSLVPNASPPPPPPPPPNPDDPILAQAHAAAGRCFASMRAGPGYGPPSYFARIDVTVVPSGRVSRAEVASTDVTDPAALDCLRSTASNTRFSDNDGGPLRTYTIDVRVVAH